MALLSSHAWKWAALIAFLFAPGVVVAYLLHSAVWIAVAPIIFVLLMIVIAVLLSGETTSAQRKGKGIDGAVLIPHQHLLNSALTLV